MYREIIEDLLNWKKEGFLKPLMLIGARQTGKTYIINQFCKENFENFLSISLDKNREISKVFDDTINPDEIIRNIEAILKINIDIKNTIIFIDEIQENERAITALKYFCESEKEYKIICAGSLLGVKINRFSSSFPVGKVIMKYLYPMNFYEFLLASKEENIIELIKEHYKTFKPLGASVHDKCIKLYKEFLCIGGMPEIVQNYIDNDCNINNVNFDIQKNIINSYLADMTKFTEKTESIKINKIYNSITNQLSKPNKKFKFSIVDKEARRVHYESSLDWLLASNMIIKSDMVSNNKSPLKAYSNGESFKLYLNDSGLLKSLSNIHYSEIILDKNEMFKGVLAENYVAATFFSKLEELYYYNFNKYEIDFLMNDKGDIIPIEVKAGLNTTSASLNNYIEKYNPIYSIRLSLKNFGFENNIKSIPLYALFCLLMK